MTPLENFDYVRKLLARFDERKGQRYFGCTKTGKFQCEHDAVREGCRPTRNGQ